MSARLYVGNLSFHVTEEVLRSAFAEAGEVTDAHVVLDRESGRSRGFGFVTMATAELGQAAIEQMNGRDLEGRPIRVNLAEDRPPRRTGGPSFGGGGGGPREGGSAPRGPRGGGGGGGGGFGQRPERGFRGDPGGRAGGGRGSGGRGR